MVWEMTSRQFPRIRLVFSTVDTRLCVSPRIFLGISSKLNNNLIWLQGSFGSVRLKLATFP